MVSNEAKTGIIDDEINDVLNIWFKEDKKKIICKKRKRAKAVGSILK
jgi:hypothetical protein